MVLSQFQISDSEALFDLAMLGAILIVVYVAAFAALKTVKEKRA